MASSMTTSNYPQQVNQAYGMLKNATQQQLQIVAQQVAQNPNSPEAIALPMAIQYQQQMRAPQPQAPQGTILEQKLAQIPQAPAPSPVQGGLPAVGQNQVNLQQAAQQDPMRNAGIGIAPENTEPQQEQTAATGGIVALAGGGQVRQFYNGGDTSTKGLGSLDRFAKSDDTDIGYEGPYEESYEEPVKTKIARLDPVENPANPNSSAAKEAASPTAKESIAMYRDLLGSEADLSEEVSMAKDMAKEAGRDKNINAMIQGIGGMLSAKTPYTSQAVGAGLLAGASGYAQGATEERSAQKDLMALQAAHKKALVSGDREAATMYLNNMAKQQEAAALAKAKREDRADEQRTKYGVAGIEGEYGLKKQELSNNAAYKLEAFKADNAQDLERIKQDIDVAGGLKPQHKKDLMNALINSEMYDNPEDMKIAYDSLLQSIVGTPTTTPKTSYGAPISGSSLKYSPPPTQ